MLRASGECTRTFYVGDYYEEHGFPIDEGEDPGGWSCYSQETSYFYAGGQAAIVPGTEWKGMALRTVYPYEVEPYRWEYTSTVYYLHHDYLGNLSYAAL